MLKLAGSGSVAAIAGMEASTPALSQTAHPSVPRWEIFELTLAGPSTGNPFMDVQLSASFSLGNRTASVDGFYDGAGTYKIRFMPDTAGTWSYMTSSNVPSLNNRTGQFTCTAANPGVHGTVGVRNTHHFAYADGTPYFPFGTTCYAWIHQPEKLQRQTLESLRAAPFNKIRMCVFPKSFEYNHNEPALYPFERSAAGVSDFTRLNPAFFAHLEERILDLDKLGIEADLILFHPYDRWGYSSMPAEADDRYLRYVLARLSAYRNVWWSLANEYDLMKAKSTQDFDRFFHIVEQHDPSNHLRSVHYSRVMYDYARPWVTHASLQTYDFNAAPGWLEAWRKPVVYDEIMYEGNLNRRWGNISGQEMVRRFWLGTMAGCYVTHGETYLDPNQPMDENTTPTIWWAHGGTLKGTSPQRIAFLRKLVEETAAGSKSVRTGLEATPNAYYLNAVSYAQGGEVAANSLPAQEIIFYTDFHQPVYYEFPLPEGSFSAELIDPWEMTVKALPGTFAGKVKIRLNDKPYQAIRFRRLV
jgi:hypothetical protein